MDTKGYALQKNPENTASLLSRVFFCFVNPFLWKGYKKELDETDLHEVLPKDEVKGLTDKLEKCWNNEQVLCIEKGKPPKLLNAVARCFGKEFMAYGLLLVLDEGVRIIQPLFMGGLIRYFKYNSDMPKSTAYIYASAIAVCSALYAVMHHPYFYGIQKIGMRIRVSTSGLIFKKSLRLSSAAMHKTGVGQIVNILSNDVARFDFSVIFLHYVWVVPLTCVAFIGLLWNEIGVSCLAGFGGLLFIVPIQGYCGKLMGKYRRAVAGKADKRIEIMNQILNGIRVIKMYAWEKPFSKLVESARRAEVRQLQYQAFAQAIVIGIFYATGKVIILCAIAAYVLSGNAMDAEKVFTASAWFNFARLSISLFLPFAFQFGFESKVTLERIQEQENTILDGINLEVHQGQLLAIIGPVGAGKSSILSSLLGEMECVEGTVTIQGKVAYAPQEPWVFSSTLRQNVTFGAEFDQELYIKTIRAAALKKDIDILPNGDSTLVGDRGVALSGGQRARVNLARALYRNADVYLFDDPLSAVDATVGRFLFEKCIVNYLSDKVRILVTHQLQYLAKADCIIMLRDGKIIAKGTLAELQVNGEEFTKILEETELSYRKRLDSTPKKVVRNTISVESYDDSKTSTPKSAKKGNMFTDETDILIKDSKTKLSVDSDDMSDDPSQKLMNLSESSWSLALPGNESILPDQTEERSSGAVKWNVYYQYLRAMAHPCLLFLLVLFLILVQALFNAIDWWINVWATQAEYEKLIESNSSTINLNTTYPVKPTFYLDGWTTNDFLSVHAILVGALVVLSLCRTIWFRVSLTISSLTLHAKMFYAVIRSPTKFFDNNNTGRILNRFSKDTGAMDEQLGFVTFDFIQGMMQFVSILLVIGLLNPMVFIPTIPLAFVFMFIRYYYLRTSRDVKRLEATTRSPVFSHISASLNGLATIRAFKAENDVLNNYYQYSNVNTACFALFLSTSRWLAVVIDWLCAFYIGFVAFISVYAGQDMESGEVALSLLYSITLTGMLAHFSQQGATLENTMVSVERIIDYGKLPPEPPLESSPDKEPPKTWPDKGKIVFDHVTLKYNEGPPVLKDITCTILQGEKVGIVGRTGAGKSSLLNVLFRLNDLEGRVLIDGIDTKGLGLHDLRKRLSIIPQDPVLFIGTLRKNLDPFGEFGEDQMWQALSDVQLKSVIQGMQNRMDTHLQEGGANLSVGQKQLVCLARALLRRSRILVIDEATANVDPETDKLIQLTIRDKFRDCTVLTIAHRLNTIMDSDRVLNDFEILVETLEKVMVALRTAVSLRDEKIMVLNDQLDTQKELTEAQRRGISNLDEQLSLSEGARAVLELQLEELEHKLKNLNVDNE